MRRLSESEIKLVIASILLLFVLQEIAIHNYISEPYPALRMPPFSGNNMNEDGVYQTTSVEIKIFFENKERLLLAPNKFFFDAPTSHHLVLTNKFKPADKSEKLSAPEKLEILKPIIPGFFISRYRSSYEVQHHPETLDWLRKQIGKIKPDQSPTQISFYWYRDLYHPDQLLTRDRELIETNTIEL